MDLSEPFFNNKVSDQLLINTNPTSIAELQQCLRRISNSKTPGPDYIPALIWKSHHFQDQLHEFCNETFIGNKPRSFSKSDIQPTPKKGNLRLPKNHRGITLSPNAKVYRCCKTPRFTTPLFLNSWHHISSRSSEETKMVFAKDDLRYHRSSISDV